MYKLIIDTDPGVDDALAIMMAVFSKLNICGITTVYGNSTQRNCSKNALTILELIVSKIKVYDGASAPISGQKKLAESHGENGLGGFKISNLQSKPVGNAIQFYKSVLRENSSKSINILAMGPLTNLAILGRENYELLSRINNIIILGGVFGEAGNITPYAEFNTYNDPEALEEVLKFPCKKTLIPANVCRKVIFNREDFEKLNRDDLKKSISKITDMYIRYYEKDKVFGGFAGGVMYDLLTVCYILDPSLFKVNSAFVSVDTSVSSTRGRTTIDKSARKNCSVVYDVEPDAIKNLFFKIMNKATGLAVIMNG